MSPQTLLLSAFETVLPVMHLFLQVPVERRWAALLLFYFQRLPLQISA